jgi:uncharacterized protein involved in exopolysaccharide biosynthesis
MKKTWFEILTVVVLGVLITLVLQFLAKRFGW